MTRVLLTAFEPYERWTENSSWLALIELTQWYDGHADLTTRRYPVDLALMSGQLKKDLQDDYDLAIHLGQAPGIPLIKLESIGLNVRGDGTPLLKDAPAAYQSSLPLERCRDRLIESGIPCEVSHHAGTYLCNAALYLSQHFSHSFAMKTRSVFIHLPLSPAQAARDSDRLPSMSTPMVSAALAMIVETLSE
ncbi:Pyrrolidone-carboxylate peptidase [Novipirellula galeiformis]|uniref:Pyrrolidone-carboxylate peptidase n=1 Tax=Novipirellula galeiformis TaxID=2528004 RepID=A0A5C6CD01_9BACT|nr:pyroglutamyl-peptidase I [Novipirellula galeiformis]TWU22012.1 Pyrrolidone-carboxylate peptidase [Novipirellula galeiformis]